MSFFKINPLMLLAFASLTALTPASDTNAQDIQGIYSINAQASDDINQAIDKAVADMNFIKRPIARGRLKKTNPAYQQIAIKQTEQDLSITLDTRKPIVMPANGQPIKWTREDGEKFDVHARVDATELQQTFIAEDGQRVNSFRLGPDGNTLTLQVTLTSSQLPQPLTYQLRYQRAAHVAN